MGRRRLYSFDLFAGCGGLSLGLRQAGFSTLAFSELNRDAADTFDANLGGKEVLRVGDVHALTTPCLKQMQSRWKDDGKQVHLVCGGPPCQGYSGIGHRRSYPVERSSIPANYLFRRMVKVVKTLQPSIFLFENVRGLVTGRWTRDGTKGEIWNEVRETFGNLEGYEIGWRLVHAKEFGVPQNRPRLFLVGVHRRLGLLLPAGSPSSLENPRGLLPFGEGAPPDMVDVLSDLDDPQYAAHSHNDRYLFPAMSRFQRIMRTTSDGSRLRVGNDLSEQFYSRHSEAVVEKFKHMLAHQGDVPTRFQTRKFAQRVLPKRWGDDGPTITVTSLPDDFVHYRRPRILTVREWARLQTFPDWFQFKGPRTTGGMRRAGNPTEGLWEREVPKYTQIGNAVPVDMARAVGVHLARILHGALD